MNLINPGKLMPLVKSMPFGYSEDDMQSPIDSTFNYCSLVAALYDNKYITRDQYADAPEFYGIEIRYISEIRESVKSTI